MGGEREQRREGAAGSLADAWEAQAHSWTAWARAPGHDSYWRFHRDRFLELLPAPGRLTVDDGCGEGRLTRDLKALGHRVVSFDVSPTMIEQARGADAEGDYRVASASALPLDDASADLVAAFMSLQDMDDMPGAVAEAARVLQPGGRLCAAVVHPINSGGGFEGDPPDSRFVLDHSYFDRSIKRDEVERSGMRMVFTGWHFLIEDYSRALERAGLLIERIREVTDTEHRVWHRAPLFLHFRAVKPA